MEIMAQESARVEYILDTTFVLSLVALNKFQTSDMDNETAPSSSEPRPIRRLSENLINKIAAGEVRSNYYVMSRG